MLDQVSAPNVDPIREFSSARRTPRALWYRPARGEALVGIGSARTVSSAAAALEAGTSGQVLMGGLTFDAAAAPTALWDGFGPAQFFVPERLLSLRDGEATLTTASLHSSAESPAPREAAPARLGLEPDAWKMLVSDLAAEMRAGQADVTKVVLARARQVRFSVSLESILRQLANTYPACTIFAFATDDACFVGATPEQLISLHQGTATTMALAGSAPRGATPEDDRTIGARLLADPKERTEHRVVTDALREALAPVCTRLVADAQPQLKRLPNVQHLMTPIRAQVTPGTCVLDLVERLHPTPAVGGYPRTPAIEVIRDREKLDRGWYAAPFGWVDGNGDGELVVALRSALLRGDSATLFAGCGIVAESDPERELAEWGWKLRPMLSALGVRA